PRPEADNRTRSSWSRRREAHSGDLVHRSVTILRAAPLCPCPALRCGDSPWRTRVDLSRKRVLVVDDHPGMRNSLRRALEVCGISGAHAVRNAHEAVARLRNMRYDIVLADFDLGPGPDGQQLLEHCRAEH